MQEQQIIHVDPMAAVMVERKDNAHQRNERLVLENEVLALRKRVEEQEEEIVRLNRMLDGETPEGPSVSGEAT